MKDRNRIYRLEPAAIQPERKDVFAALKLPVDSDKYDLWFHEALKTFARLVLPVALVQEISVGEFKEVLAGEGNNEPSIPIEEVLSQAREVALYAATAGEELSETIGQMFRSGDEVRALFLDAVASRGAENMTEALKTEVLRCWKEAGSVAADSFIEAYSPGYCGWHVSGQKKLFASLRPEQIGIRLNESCLMNPLKSVSGALITGKKELFLAEDVYPFCVACAHRSCDERKRRIESCSS